MRAALATLLMIAVLPACSGGGEGAGLVTVVPQRGPKPSHGGWSLPVQFTVAQQGKRVSAAALGHVD
jgi:hypothetical protein